MQMKKRISSLLLVLCLTAGLIPLSAQTASAATEGTEEKAWYPAARMYIVQIAYESGSGASHKDRNTFDIANTTNKDLTEADKRIFAPFTGIIVFKDAQYNFVLLQSKEKVLYADGTLDYMTVGFMHDNKIDDLKLGQVIKQGDPFYDAGKWSKGKEDPNMGKHVQITVYKGQLYNVNSREKDGSYKKLHDFGKNWQSKGTADPYNAFFVNTNKTKADKYTEVGYLAKGHTVSKKGALGDWGGKWKDLNGNPFPTLPTISGSEAPGILEEGKSFSIKGKVSSKTKLLSVTAGVYNAETGGKMMTGGTVKPSNPYQNPTPTRKTSYNLTKSTLASLVKFNKLPAGTYWYRVTATNGGGTVTLVNQRFTVQGTQTQTKPTQTKPAQTQTPQTEPEKTTVYISGANYPETLKAGESFSIRGTISATAPISYIAVEVYSAEGGQSMNIGGTMSLRANCKSYDLANFTSDHVQFQMLPAGTYWYRIRVGTAAGETTMMDQKFTVVELYAAPAPTSTAKIVYPADGWYTFSPACAPGMMLDVAYSGVCSEDPVWIWAANGSPAQLWHLIPYGANGSNILWAGVDPDTRMVLDVQLGGITSGTPVWQYEFNGSLAQQWIFMDAGDGYYYIVPSENQSLTLAVKGGSSAEGSSLVVETRNGSLGQKWKLTRY